MGLLAVLPPPRCFLLTFSLVLLALASTCAAAEAPPDGTYLLRLLFVRHGFSCANVPWKACTKQGEKLTPAGMGDQYAQVTQRIDELLREKEPASMVGMDFDFGIKPRGWPIPGQSKTSDGKSDDCLVKVRNRSLVDGQYDEFGNLVAVRQLMKDPHITACDQKKAQTAGQLMSQWLRMHGMELDMIGSSSLKRAIETAELVFAQSNESAGIPAITVLPYINEWNEGTPFQPENFPYDHITQQQQIRQVLGKRVLPVAAGLTDGPGAYPRQDQQWDKFKAVLALEVLPHLVAGSPEDWQPNPVLVAALEAGREQGKPAIPERSSWPQVRNEPLRDLSAGKLRYTWAKPVAAGQYTKLRSSGAQEFIMGIGSHSGLLRDYCNEGRARPHNLAVLEKRLVVTVTTSADGQTAFQVAEEDGPCRPIIEAPAAPEPGSLTEADLGSACRSPIDMRVFMDLQSTPSEGKDTACMASAAELKLVLSGEAEQLSPLLGEDPVRLVLVVAAGLGSVVVMLATGRIVRRARRREVVTRAALLPRDERC